MAMRMPRMTKMFLASVTSRFVNIIEIAFVSLVTRVTSLPTGISFSCSWASDSMWVNRSSRRSEIMRWPTRCKMTAWR